MEDDNVPNEHKVNTGQLVAGAFSDQPSVEGMLRLSVGIGPRGRVTLHEAF